MNDSAILVERLGKSYRLGTQRAARDYVTLRETLASILTSPKAWVDRRLEQKSDDSYWALRDVSFNVRQGEVVGIIGRNGAGKSTLLKILSRITEATEGRVTIRGRVASLLEVGTGFHPELTGRENIFLNGAILGMTRAEIARKFDEIVAFAEVEQFLDTPVKRYSSGMYVRLAFAVAAHIEPEILVVDEVLAVGDAEFQRKCLGKMNSVAKEEGRTVLFVSHNMDAVTRLCTTGIVLNRGRIEFTGDTHRAVAAYSGSVAESSSVDFKPSVGAPCITKVVVDPRGILDGDIVVDISFSSPFPLSPPIAGLVVASATGVPVYGSNPRFHVEGHVRSSVQDGTVRFIGRQLPLASGNYRLSVWLGDWQTDYDQKLDVLSFEFRPNATAALRPPSEVIGYVDWPGRWETL